MSNHKLTENWAQHLLNRKAALDHHALDDYSTIFNKKYFIKPLVDVCKPFKGTYQIRENISSFIKGLKRFGHCIAYLVCQILPIFIALAIIGSTLPAIILVCVTFTLAEIFNSGFKRTSVKLKNFIRDDLLKLLSEIALRFVAVCDAMGLTIVNLTYAAAQIISPLKIIPRIIITLVMHGFRFQPIEENPSIKKLVTKDSRLKSHESRDLGVHKIAKALNKGQFTKFIPVSTELSSEVRAAKIFYKMSVAARPAPAK